MLKDSVRDRLGFAFFAFTALVTAAAAWQNPSVLGWLYVLHNFLLAWFYTRRTQAARYDRCGLWLGMIAALLPSVPFERAVSWYLLLPGLAGYALCLWALLTLGPRFGVAPADRGLTMRGPYRWIRHPMYLGELVFRVVLVFTTNNLVLSAILAVLLTGIQIWRIRREEALLQGYECYRKIVHWRLLPGVW